MTSYLKVFPRWEYLLLTLGLLMLCGGALADPCPQANVVCPANTLCMTWTAPAVRQSGAILPVSELRAFDISLGTALIGTTAGNQTGFNYPVPTDTTIAANSLLSIAAIDTDGTKGDAASCTLPKAIAGPKSKPGAPGNVKVQ